VFRLDRFNQQNPRRSYPTKIFTKEKEQPLVGVEFRTVPAVGKIAADDRIGQKGFTRNTGHRNLRNRPHAFGKNPVAWENFRKFPELYRRIRIDTIQRDKSKDIALFRKRVERLIQKSEQGEMFGAWNDYGRLLNY